MNAYLSPTDIMNFSSAIQDPIIHTHFLMTSNIKSNLFTIKFLCLDNHNIMVKHQAYKKWMMENLYFFLPFNLLLKMNMEWSHNWAHDNFLNLILFMMTSKSQLGEGSFYKWVSVYLLMDGFYSCDSCYGYHWYQDHQHGWISKIYRHFLLQVLKFFFFSDLCYYFCRVLPFNLSCFA